MAISGIKYGGTVPYQGATTVVSVTGTTFAAVDSNPDTITDSGTGFVTAGFKVGDTIRISGAGDAANHGTHVLDVVTAGTLTLSSASALTVDGAGDSWTISVVHPVCRAIVNKTSAAKTGVIFYFADGSTVTMDIAVAHEYPLACTSCNNTNIVFLY